jgi:hypothetical protein
MGIIINSMGGFRVGDAAVCGDQSVVIERLHQNCDVEVKEPDGQIALTRVELLSKPKKDLAQLLVGTNERAVISLKALL